MTAKTRTIRLTDEEVQALEDLFECLGIIGQRGTRLNAGVRALAQWAIVSLETTAYHLREAKRIALGELVAESETRPDRPE